jgi:hypothetical protein
VTVSRRGGHGRTGTVVSIMLGLMYGMSPENSMGFVQFVHDLRTCPMDVGSPQTSQQREQVARILRAVQSSPLLKRSYKPPARLAHSSTVDAADPKAAHAEALPTPTSSTTDALVRRANSAVFGDEASFRRAASAPRGRLHVVSNPIVAAKARTAVPPSSIVAPQGASAISLPSSPASDSASSPGTPMPRSVVDPPGSPEAPQPRKGGDSQARRPLVPPVEAVADASEDLTSVPENRVSSPDSSLLLPSWMAKVASETTVVTTTTVPATVAPTTTTAAVSRLDATTPTEEPKRAHRSLAPPVDAPEALSELEAVAGPEAIESEVSAADTPVAGSRTRRLTLAQQSTAAVPLSVAAESVAERSFSRLPRTSTHSSVTSEQSVAEPIADLVHVKSATKFPIGLLPPNKSFELDDADVTNTVAPSTSQPAVVKALPLAALSRDDGLLPAPEELRRTPSDPITVGLATVRGPDRSDPVGSNRLGQDRSDPVDSNRIDVDALLPPASSSSTIAKAPLRPLGNSLSPPSETRTLLGRKIVNQDKTRPSVDIDTVIASSASSGARSLSARDKAWSGGVLDLEALQTTDDVIMDVDHESSTSKAASQNCGIDEDGSKQGTPTWIGRPFLDTKGVATSDMSLPVLVSHQISKAVSSEVRGHTDEGALFFPKVPSGANTPVSGSSSTSKPSHRRAKTEDSTNSVGGVPPRFPIAVTAAGETPLARWETSSSSSRRSKQAKPPRTTEKPTAPPSVVAASIPRDPPATARGQGPRLRSVSSRGRGRAAPESKQRPSTGYSRINANKRTLQQRHKQVTRPGSIVESRMHGRRETRQRSRDGNDSAPASESTSHRPTPPPAVAPPPRESGATYTSPRAGQRLVHS